MTLPSEGWDKGIFTSECVMSLWQRIRFLFQPSMRVTLSFLYQGNVELFGAQLEILTTPQTLSIQNSLWEIENEDEAGEGVFFVDAPSPEKALEIYREHEKAEVVSITQVEWSSLAAVSGERGETYYFERQRKVIP